MNKTSASASAPQLVGAIPTGNKYNYDGGTNSWYICDGGNDMYNRGIVRQRLVRQRICSLHVVLF